MRKFNRLAGASRGFGLVLLATALLAACGSSDDSSPVLEVRTLNNRADLISGGDAMVEVVLPAGASTSSLKVDVDGRDVSSAFAARTDGRVTGLVTGLANGNNVISATAAGATAAKLTVTNAPRGGPVFSGAQVVPFICATPTAVPATGAGAAAIPASNFSGLAGAPDAQCNIATEFKLYYRSTASTSCTFSLPDPTPAVGVGGTTVPAASTLPANGCFKSYDATAAAPADMGTTVTDAGKTVNYIVRVERGTMNRGIYDIAVLFDPSKPWTATAPQAQWNGKILHVFGASTGQPRRQVRPATSWTSEDKALSRGYMFVTSSMTDSSRNSNRVMMSETVMMLKEHIADNYGAIKFTMGQGCSGGSINSHMNASINPGLLDGLTVNCAYPDSETTGIEVADCVQLVEAYQKPQWLALMGSATAATVNAKKAAINGHLDQTGCHAWYNLFGSNGKVGLYQQRAVLSADNATGVLTQSATTVNNCELPNSTVYDPVTNPTGARCSAWDWAANIFGKAADGIRALDTRDNEGVQYGLKALLGGSITGEEFVTLNEIIGGIDKDANFRAERSKADLPALDIAYRAGIVMSGKNLAKVAEIDTRGWDDSLIAGVPGAFGIHHIWRSFSIWDRLDREFGDHKNYAMWRFGRSLTPNAALTLESFLAMDTWLTNLKADTSANSLEAKVRSARPASAADFCIPSTDATQTLRITDRAVCDADPFLAPHSSPRQVAGGNLSENILKCALRPVSDSEYGGRLDAGQLTRVKAVFTTGVCDWTKPGIGQQNAVSPLNFRAGPGGVPFAAAPVSVPK
jgi:Tannase-like family of unknown function (DUF6351)